MGVYDPLASTLLYGGPGGGKTALAVSSFWDWLRHELVVPNGKIITFGAEDNPALCIPQECRETAKGTSLRLTSPLLDGQTFLNDFDKITRRFILDAEEGHPLDVLVIDGMSEFDLLFEMSYQDEGNDGYAKWNALLSEMFSCMMRATPQALGCPVIVTARVMEKKKAKQIGNKTVDGDPGYMDFDYYPSMRGQFRLHMPHYFNLVLYMDTVGNLKTGKPVHAASMYKGATSEYYVKNCWEHEWLAADLPERVYNKMWPELWGMLTQATETYDPTQLETNEDTEIEE